MGRTSSDIDISLDDMFGEEFATLLNKKLYPGGEKHFGVIKSNSDKSKHLETAAIRVHGVFIDLVNLRNETYAEDSRVPEIGIGSPEEDALRRDLTINTMFYNINNKEIEDFTGRGIIDLENGIIRTPLEPYQTFIDDPLRVLRTIRFATRFNFEIVPEIYEAAKDERVRVTTLVALSNIGCPCAES
jgi:tRNA nucleotidyltransferase (CCA-adding enzyme)